MLAEVCRWSWGKNLTVGSNFRFQLSPSLPHSGVPFPTRAPSMNRFLSFPLSSFFFFSSILPKRSSLRYDALTVVPGTLTGTLTTWQPTYQHSTAQCCRLSCFYSINATDSNNSQNFTKHHKSAKLLSNHTFLYVVMVLFWSAVRSLGFIQGPVMRRSWPQSRRWDHSWCQSALQSKCLKSLKLFSRQKFYKMALDPPRL